MKKCLFCEKELTSDMGYITDGKISVCMLCAGRYTLNEAFLRVTSNGVDSNIQRVFVSAFESGLTGQTDVTDESGLTGQTDVTDESGLTGQTDAAVDYSDTDSYKGMPEPDDDTPTVEEDIENLSEEDFMSKYTDDPSAIDAYMEAHKLGVYADEPDEV